MHEVQHTTSIQKFADATANYAFPFCSSRQH